MNALSIIESCAVILASLVAIGGIAAWRRELIAQKRSDLSEEVLASFFQIQEVLMTIRSPFGYQGEGKSRKKFESETPEQSELLDKAYVIIERFNYNREHFAKLNALRYRVRAVLGNTYLEVFNKLDHIVRQIHLSSHQLAYIWKEMDRTFRRSAEPDQKLKQDLMKWQDVFYGGGNEESPLTIEINQLVKDADTAFSRHLLHRRNLLSYLIKKDHARTKL